MKRLCSVLMLFAAILIAPLILQAQPKVRDSMIVSTESICPGWQLTQPSPISTFSDSRLKTDISPAPGDVNSMVM